MPIHLTITAKGQVTLRQSVLEHLGIKPGHKIGVALLPDGKVELRATGTAPDIKKLRGALRQDGQTAASLEDMQAAIEQGPGFIR